jgi:hypothetical protein
MIGHVCFHNDQLNPLVPVVVGLRTEDTVPQPETLQR